tara:strand:- start:156 stop:989 length:834 start_codon:yes stop_codon:yes gene_type:complete
MKTSLAILLFSLFVISSYSQNTKKVKGNRIVSIVQTDISSFHTIDLDEDFEIEIIYNKTPAVIIETDENLHEVIDFKVSDSVLSFNKMKRITSKKALKIKVNYNDYLNHIIATDDSEIKSLTAMDLKGFKLNTKESSKVGLTLKTDIFTFEGLDKSKVKLNLTCDSTKLVLNGNSKLEALIYAPKIAADLYQRSNAVIEGNTDDIFIRVDNNAQFMGKNLTAKTSLVIAEISSDITLEVIDDIIIEASGNSSINIYGDPKITVNTLTDTSKIQKKVK